MTNQKVKDKLNRPLEIFVFLLLTVVTFVANIACQQFFGPDFAFLPKSELLSYEEIERVAHIFVGLL